MRSDAAGVSNSANPATVWTSGRTIESRILNPGPGCISADIGLSTIGTPLELADLVGLGGLKYPQVPPNCKSILPEAASPESLPAGRLRLPASAPPCTPNRQCDRAAPEPEPYAGHLQARAPARIGRTQPDARAPVRLVRKVRPGQDTGCKVPSCPSRICHPSVCHTVWVGEGLAPSQAIGDRAARLLQLLPQFPPGEARQQRVRHRV